jgi:protein-disulfide isomerase
MTLLKVPVTDKDHSRGPADAPATLVEYGDYECPHCGAAQAVVKQLQRHFADPIRFVFRHFPLTQIHPFAETAAESAEFAASYRKFWQMHDALYANQGRLDPAVLVELAKMLALPEGELVDALSDARYTPKVRADFIGGVRSGVNGTPTFFINGVRHDGSYDFDTLAEAIASEISAQVKSGAG